MDPKTRADYLLNPDGQATAPPPLASALRGLTILQVALSVNLVGGLISAAARAYFFSLRMHGGVASPLTLVMQVWQLIFIGTSVAELLALAALAAAPPAARVRELARPALVVRGIELVLLLLSWGTAYLGSSGDAIQRALTHSYFGIADSVIGLVATVLLVELLLRLRRFAAPGNRQLAENEGLLRAGVLGAVVGRLVINFVSYPLAFHFFGLENGQWAAVAVRLPFTLLFYGLMLWLVQQTIVAVRSYQPDAVAGGDALAAGGAAAPDSSAAAYRNMLLGGLWAVGGIVITALTYTNAQQLGGRYMVAYGAIIFGGIQFLRGLTQLGGRRQ